MPPIEPIALEADGEVLKRLASIIPELPENRWYVFPDLSGLGSEISQAIFNLLSISARRWAHTYLIGLAMQGCHLAGADPVHRYRCAMLISRAGVGYGISGQVSEPNGGTLLAYDRWWLASLTGETESERQTMMVLFNADLLYLLSGVRAPNGYLADWLVVLEDVPQGSARASAHILRWALASGKARNAVLVNGHEATTLSASSSEAPAAADDGQQDPRLILLWRHAAWVPDRYCRPNPRRMRPWTHLPVERLVMPFSAMEKVPAIGHWPFGPLWI